MSNPWARNTAIERFEQDPEFHVLVDQMYYLVCDGKFSLGELKQALTIAAIKFETRRLPRLRLHFSDTAVLLQDPEFSHLANKVPR